MVIPRCSHKPDGHGNLSHHHIHPINDSASAGGRRRRWFRVPGRWWFPFEPLRNMQELEDWFIPESDCFSTLGVGIVIGGGGLDGANSFGVDGFYR